MHSRFALDLKLLTFWVILLLKFVSQAVHESLLLWLAAAMGFRISTGKRGNLFHFAKTSSATQSCKCV